MNEDQSIYVMDLWNKIVKEVEIAIYEKLKSEKLTEDQKEFIDNKIVEDLYHAGWAATEKIEKW